MKIQKRRTGGEKDAEKGIEPKKPMVQVQKDPLHGVKLKDILAYLETKYGWEKMAKRIDIRCFKFDPSIKSSLHFLRRTPWARAKVEEWYRQEH